MIYRFNEYELDTQTYQLVLNGDDVAVEPQVFDLLRYLITHRDRLVSRTELFDSIWPDRVVSDTSLSNHIKSARKVLGDSGKRQCSIKTVHSRGYQFIASVEEVINHGSDFADLAIRNAKRKSQSLGPVIMVLPFQNMGSDPDQQYFAEGMSEDITTELSRFTDIQVIARHTAFQFNSSSLDIEKLSEKMKVDYFIEGSVRCSSDRIRINAQLIDAHTATHIWAERYDQPVDQVFNIQDNITETIVSTVSGQIRRVETDRARSRSTSNLRAYDHLLRGLFYHKNGYPSYDNYIKATEEFSKAIELDPGFARAQAWILCSGASLWNAKSEENINASIEAGKRALALDEKESETHRILGSLYLYTRNYELSGHHYEIARRLSPNDAHIAVKMGRYYAYISEFDKALDTVERAMHLNPEHPGWYWQELGLVHYSMENYQKAVSCYSKNWEAGDIDYALLAAAYVALNEMKNARRAAQKALQLEPRASSRLYTQFETYQDEAKHQLLHDRMLTAGIPN